MKSYLVVAAVSLASSMVFVGCFDEMSATLDLEAPVTVRDGTVHLDDLQSRKTFTLQPGHYDADLKYRPSQHQLKFSVQRGGQKLSATMNISRDVNLPTTSGSFKLSHDQIGQDWDFAGALETSAVESEPIREVQTCSRFPAPNPPVPPYPGGPYPYGYRTVIYHFLTTTTHVTAEFLRPQSAGVLGKMNASRSDRERVYDEIGPCLP